MPKKAGIVFVAMGAVLILSALLLFFYNRAENDRAGQKAGQFLEDVQSVISERMEETAKPNENTVSEKATDEETAGIAPQEMAVVEIDGCGYIGYLSIPALNMELPVMSEWDYDRLQIAPCRQFGSTWTDDLVIAAHNYKTHFGNLSSLSEKDRVVFTDMDGNENFYEVEAVETIDPTAVDDVQNSGYDLVLYTCTYSGATRVAVFCNRIES